MTYIEGQRQFPIDTRKEKLVFPIELRRESPYKIVSDENRELLEQLNLEMRSSFVKGVEANKQPVLFQQASDEFQQLCESLPWEEKKLPAELPDHKRTKVIFTGITYGYYSITHPGKFVVAKMKNPDNPEQELTIILSKSAFKKPSELAQPKPRKLSRKAALGKAAEYQTKPKTETKKIPMTRITIYPGVRLFTFEGDPKIRLEGQTDEQREGTLNQHYKPLVVERKVKMIVPGKNSLDAYKHTEGTFFRGTIGGKEYWATIGDVKQFAEIGREREKQFPQKAA